MKERPILFSGPMVRALLAGTKTQTRRVVKSKYPSCHVEMQDGWPVLVNTEEPEAQSVMTCPYGQLGDWLWVKETTVKVEDHGYEGPVYAESDYGRSVIEYGLCPDPDDVTEVEPENIKLRPSIFMPKTMSRITLEITGVRVERLQNIRESDAMAEGAEPLLVPPDGGSQPYVEGYCELWESINGPESWSLNPLVWVVQFKAVQP